jgi:nicotinamidase-related amidase
MNVPPITTTETALLLIDLQNGFLDEAGFVSRSYGGLSPSLSAVVRPAERLLAAARAAEIPVIHTQHAWEEGYRDGGFLVEEILPKLAGADGLEPSEDLVVGSWEADFFPRRRRGRARRRSRAPVAKLCARRRHRADLRGVDTDGAAIADAHTHRRVT